jgi:iron complex transport system ATP-binding protein
VSGDSFLEIGNVSFSYDKKKQALRDFSLSVAVPEAVADRPLPAEAGHAGGGIFLSIIGPNGCGKTTLMKLIAGILEPNAGQLRLLGQEITRKTDPSKILAYVPQTLTLGFSLSVLDFVLLGISSGAGLSGKVSRKAVEKARQALRLLRAEEYEDRDMLRLSGGERQKIIVSKALAQDTPVLLLDEPMTHLDLAGQIEILELLKKLSVDGGKKIIAIMHDINLAARYSDYTLMMKDGRLFAAGKTREVVTEESIARCFSVTVERVGDFFVPVGAGWPLAGNSIH